MLDRAYRLLSTPPLSRLGIHRFGARVYRSALARFSDEAVGLSVGGVPASFRTEEVGEIRQFAGDFLGAPKVSEILQTESDVLESVLDEIRGGDVFADVGAHLGLYTCLVQNQLDEDGQVLAFEPFPRNYRSLRANIERNDGPAEAHEMALSDEDGEEEFFVYGSAVGYPENSLRPNFGSGESITVKTRTGDSFFREYGRTPDVVKVDVEGAELQVLEGMEDTLRESSCRAVLCEVHRFSIDEGDEARVEGLLRDCGFETSVVSTKGDLTYWIRADRHDRGTAD